MKFKIEGQFEAESIDRAFAKLAAHFAALTYDPSLIIDVLMDAGDQITICPSESPSPKVGK